jgi:carboxypeptidase family protein/TonB-dependent receptor-like protein
MRVLESDHEATTSREALKQVAGSLARFARRIWPVLLALVLFLLSPAAQAQLYTGSVTGLVTDPSGASVPGAKVSLVDQDKGFAFNAVTDSTGRYLLRSIPPGTYRIRVEAASFQSQSEDAIKVDVTQNVSIDFSLKVGVVNDVVEVKADSVHLQTEDAVTGQVVNRKFLNDLPSIGRDPLGFAFLAPGVTDADTQAPGGINFISNGGRNSTADILLDGVSATNFEQNSGINTPAYVPSIDAVEEFKVEQSNFNAEYGFTGGTILNIVTRSGTNEFHGSAYEFLRNSAADANDFFNNLNNNPIPALKKNNFGGTVGGPIIKKKTFFFFDYEGTRESNAASGTFGVPSLCERGDPSAVCPVGQSALGNFGELCTARGFTFDNTGLCSDLSGQIYDPYTGSPDPANPGGALRANPIPFNNIATYGSPGKPNLNGTPFQVPNPGQAGNLIDPVAQKLFLLFPIPTLNATDIGTLQTNNFFSSGVNTNRSNQFDIKIDHRFSDSDILSVKYSHQNNGGHQFNCFGNIADNCTQGPNNGTQNLAAINHTHIFSPTLVLTVSYGFNRQAGLQQGIKGDFRSLNPVTDLGLPAYMLLSGRPQYPNINLPDYNSSGGTGNIGTQTFSIVQQGQDTHHLAGAISWVRGKHELKFGAEGRLHRINFANPGNVGGQFTFDTTGTAQSTLPSPVGGDDLASFLIGVGNPVVGSGPGVYEVPNIVSTQNFRVGGFVQDNYRITGKLTLNLGFRYEVSLPRTERFNRMNWLDPNVVSPIDSQLTSAARAALGGGTIHGAEVFASSQNRYNYDVDYKNLQPRFGLAYQLPHTLVLRGGYGIYYTTPRSGAAGTGPWGFQGFLQTTPWLTTLNNDGVTPIDRLSAPFGSTGPIPSPGSSLGALNDIGFDAVGPVQRVSLRVPYEQVWSFGFQKELPGKIVLDASYVGKKGTHLYFSGARQFNHLSQQTVDSMTPAQLGDLNNQVPNPFLGVITDLHSSLSGPTVTGVQLLLPFPQYTGFLGDAPPLANSMYHALQIRAEKSFSHGLQFLTTYTFSKSIDDASSTDESITFLGGVSSLQNPNNPAGERSVSTFDIPQIWQLSYVYELPVGRGRWLGRDIHPVLNAIIGGWQANGIWRITGGRPILISLSGTFSAPIPTYGQRPDLVGTLQRASGSLSNIAGSGGNYFANATDPSDPNSVLQQPAAFTLGSAPRAVGNVRQPGTNIATMSLFKEFPLTKLREGMRFEFRVEAFNVFNHPNFAGPHSTFGDSDFGTITSTTQAAREMQLGLKLYF